MVCTPVRGHSVARFVCSYHVDDKGWLGAANGDQIGGKKMMRISFFFGWGPKQISCIAPEQLDVKLGS